MQVAKKPEYFANKMTLNDYDRMTTPGGETIRTARYNLSMYTSPVNGDENGSGNGTDSNPRMAMSIYHDPKNTFTYLKR